MVKRKHITVLDIGSSFVKVVIAEIITQEKPRVVGVGKTQSAGMRKGAIIDLEDVAKSIRTSIKEAEKMSGFQVEDVYTVVGGSHLRFVNTKGTVIVGKADGEVVEEDVERVIDSGQAINLPNNYEILHIIPQNFSLDDQKEIREPIGMTGMKLEMNGIVIAGFAPYLKNIAKCLDQIGLNLSGFVASPLASSKAVLAKRQKELGVVSIDIGGATTSLAVFEERELIYLSILPIGANHITNDVAIGMRTAIDVAEKVKLKYGSAIPEEIDKKEKINLAGLCPEEEGVVSRQHIAEIIEARVEEIFQLVEKDLKKINKSALLPAGAILTGGGSCLYGMVDLAKENLKLPAQIGFPNGLSGLVDKIDDPSCAVVVGAVLWIIEEGHQSVENHSTGRIKNELGNKIIVTAKKWMKDLLPGS